MDVNLYWERVVHKNLMDELSLLSARINPVEWHEVSLWSIFRSPSFEKTLSFRRVWLKNYIASDRYFGFNASTLLLQNHEYMSLSCVHSNGHLFNDTYPDRVFQLDA